MKTLRTLVSDVALYEGEAMQVPRVGDAIRQDEQVVPIEGVTWDFRDDDVVKRDSRRRQSAVHLLGSIRGPRGFLS
jgi:hypothetical protein